MSGRLSRICFTVVFLLALSGGLRTASAQELHPSPLPVPVSASAEKVAELAWLFRLMVKPTCSEDQCLFGAETKPTVSLDSEPERKIPATLTVVFAQALREPAKTYIALVLEFTDERTNENWRVSAIDVGLDGVVDVMVLQSVTSGASGEERLDEKACFARLNPHTCSTPTIPRPLWFDLSFYADTVASLAEALRKDLKRRSSVKS